MKKKKKNRKISSDSSVKSGFIRKLENKKKLFPFYKTWSAFLIDFSHVVACGSVKKRGAIDDGMRYAVRLSQSADPPRIVCVQAPI